jgi:hypothetical protein
MIAGIIGGVLCFGTSVLVTIAAIGTLIFRWWAGIWPWEIKR